MKKKKIDLNSCKSMCARMSNSVNPNFQRNPMMAIPKKCGFQNLEYYIQMLK